MKKLEERTQSERIFHNKRFRIKPKLPRYYEHGLRNWYSDYKKAILKRSGVLIEIGAGLESIFIEDCIFINLLGKKFKKAISIDISEVAISTCKEFESENLIFKVDDGHILKSVMTDEENVFVGRGIVHHLDVNKFLEKIIQKTEKNSATFIFAEPIAGNPFLRLYRLMTPLSRTKYEKPLTTNVIRTIRSSAKNTSVRYYGFASVIYSILFNKSSMFMEGLDFVLLNKCGLGRFLAWAILIEGWK